MTPSLLTANPHTTWAYSVAEDGQVILGSTHPRQAIAEQQLTDLVTGMRHKDEDLAAMTPDQARTSPGATCPPGCARTWTSTTRHARPEVV